MGDYQKTTKADADAAFREALPKVFQNAQETKSGTPHASTQAPQSISAAPSYLPPPNQTSQAEAAKAELAAQQAAQAEQARQSSIFTQNSDAIAKQEAANAGAGTSLFALNSKQQAADSTKASPQQPVAASPLGQPIFEGSANISPVISQTKPKMAPGAPASSQISKINQTGPGAQNGMVNSAMPSQEQLLKFGGA